MVGRRRGEGEKLVMRWLPIRRSREAVDKSAPEDSMTSLKAAADACGDGLHRQRMLGANARSGVEGMPVDHTWVTGRCENRDAEMMRAVAVVAP